MDSDRSLETTSKKTANDLRTITHSQLIRELTPLSLPEIDAVVDLVARVVPAGNVPGVILNGLARLPGRRPPPQTVKRDINLLFNGVEQALDKALYTAFFAGPAAMIWGCQNLLRLAGKDPNETAHGSSTSNTRCATAPRSTPPKRTVSTRRSSTSTFTCARSIA
jgi:hypothetical protein